MTTDGHTCRATFLLMEMVVGPLPPLSLSLTLRFTHQRTMTIGNIATMIELNICTIAANQCVYLWTKANGSCQAPFAARCPRAECLGHLIVHCLTHHWL